MDRTVTRGLALLAVVVVAGCATPQAKPASSAIKSKADVAGFLKKWRTVHERAALSRAKTLWQCDKVEVHMLDVGERWEGSDYDSADKAITTGWTAVGCESTGTWVVVCPPMGAVNVPAMKAGQVACEVNQRAEHNREGAKLFQITDPGEVVVVDGPAPDAPVGPEAFPDD